MLPRFLATEIDLAAGTASLSAVESHHLTHVLRLRAGDEVASSARASIESSAAMCTFVSRRKPSRRPSAARR